MAQFFFTIATARNEHLKLIVLVNGAFIIFIGILKNGKLVLRYLLSFINVS